jgi:hypothetical protein
MLQNGVVSCSAWHRLLGPVSELDLAACCSACLRRCSLVRREQLVMPCPAVNLFYMLCESAEGGLRAPEVEPGLRHVRHLAHTGNRNHRITGIQVQTKIRCRYPAALCIHYTARKCYIRLYTRQGGGSCKKERTTMTSTPRRISYVSYISYVCIYILYVLC